MKTLLSVPRVALVALALATAGATATFAQTTTTTPATAPACTPGGHHHGFGNVLTDAEKAQLKAAYEKAIAANPSFQTQQESLKEQFKALKSSGTATVEQKQALRQQEHALRKQIEAAELAADPTLAPVFAKLKAAHKEAHSTT